MTTTRKLVIWLGAPVVVLTGLLLVWGVRNAAQLKAQIEQWADSLEHSASPVVLHLRFIPLYVDGHKVGKLQTVVVQRDRPGAVDSVRVVVDPAGASAVERVAGCALRLDPAAFERSGPFGVRQAVRCVSDTTGLVRFGSLVVSGTGREAAIFLAEEDVPCDHPARAGTIPCTDFRNEIHRFRDEIRDEIRIHMRPHVREIRREVRDAARMRH